MHEINFLELSKVKIIEIVNVEIDNDIVVATLITSHFNRVTEKPFMFDKSEWEKVKKRGYVE